MKEDHGAAAVETPFELPSCSESAVVGANIPALAFNEKARQSLVADSPVKQREDVTPQSRGAIAPESCFGVTLEKQEGAGKAERKTHPQPRVQCRKHTSYSPQVQPERPGLPCAMVLTALCALSPVSVT